MPDLRSRYRASPRIWDSTLAVRDSSQRIPAAADETRPRRTPELKRPACCHAFWLLYSALPSRTASRSVAERRGDLHVDLVRWSSEVIRTRNALTVGLVSAGKHVPEDVWHHLLRDDQLRREHDDTSLSGNPAVGAGAASGRERQVAREGLRVAPEGRDAIALPAGSGVATDGEEGLIGGAGSTWQDDLHFAEG